MKKIIGIIVAVSAIVLFGGVQAYAKKASGKASGEAKIEFVEKTFDFGKIAENGGDVSHEFEFVNKGDGNLVIFKATAECGCTRPSFPAKAIAPGKSGKIKVTYRPVGRPYGFEKVVTVTSNGTPRKVRLKIRGYVEPAK